MPTYLDLRGTKLRDNGKVAEALRGLVAIARGNGSHWCVDPYLHDERVEDIVEHIILQQEEEKEKVYECLYMYVIATIHIILLYKYKNN